MLCRFGRARLKQIAELAMHNSGGVFPAVTELDVQVVQNAPSGNEIPVQVVVSQLESRMTATVAIP